MTVHIFPNAKFHDGTPVTAALVADALNGALPRLMGPAFDDVKQITGIDATTVRIDLHRRSQFIVDALETAVQRPGKAGVGTGPYVAVPGTSPPLLKANAEYYRERPSIRQISVTSYPSVRAAWAELLRGNLDMLNEVNSDALDSLQGASNIAVFSYVRHYQYMVVFGPNAPALKSPEVRRALSAALDREAIVREALGGHAVPSTGPMQSDHWAIAGTQAAPVQQREAAKELAKRHLKFTCLVPPDSVYERVALAVRQQLAAVSVDMQIVEASQEQIAKAGQSGEFEALLGDVVSGPTMFRQYRHWFSGTQALPKPLGSPAIDAALERINHAVSDDEYRSGVRAFLRAMADEPPALFLAWPERARAVSRRFNVPAPEKSRDILSSIRLWRPAAPGGAN